MLYLSDDLKTHFGHQRSQDIFDKLMNINGECYRNQNGRLTQRICINDQYYFIKQHYGVGWKEIIKNLLQLKRPVISAHNEWHTIHKLKKLNICVPVLHAFGYEGLNPARCRSFVLMEALDDTISLETLTKTWRTKKPTFNFKYRLIKEIANIAKTLHENGINHRDFYLCHFLLRKNEPGEHWKLFLIDLHRAQIRQKTPKRWLMKDLIGLYFSSKDIELTNRDYYRFIKIYRNATLKKVFSQESKLWSKVKKSGEGLYRDHNRT